MPSKVISKTIMSCVNKAHCLGVCLKPCKLSKPSGPLGRLPSETVELYLSCRNNKKESADTSFDSCNVGCNNEDKNDSELASDNPNSQKPPLEVDTHQFNEGLCQEILLDTSESYLEMTNHTPVDCGGIYEFKSGDDSHLDFPQVEFCVEDNSSSDATDFCCGSPIDGKIRNNDISDSNIYYTIVDEQDTLLQGDKKREDICDEVLANSDDSWFGLDLQFEVNHQGYEYEPFLLDSESTAALNSDFFNDLPSLLDPECDAWLLSPPNDTSSKKPITLVLDLDETLVHTTVTHCDDTNFSFQLEERVLYVQKRPFLHTFLERISELFQITIFTAGTRNYADHILDTLDPGRKLISRRAYRDSCTFSDNSYTKDLTVFGVDLAKLAIVDNTPSVFHEVQVNNGIPIKSWFGDPTDRELLSLLPFLETLANADDVRPLIAEKFGSIGSL